MKYEEMKVYDPDSMMWYVGLVWKDEYGVIKVRRIDGGSYYE